MDEKWMTYLAWMGPAGILFLTMVLRKARLFILRTKADKPAPPAAEKVPGGYGALAAGSAPYAWQQPVTAATVLTPEQADAYVKAAAEAVAPALDTLASRATLLSNDTVLIVLLARRPLQLDLRRPTQ